MKHLVASYLQEKIDFYGFIAIYVEKMPDLFAIGKLIS